jgi:hypothetical protein
MVAYRFADARSLYAILDGVEALVVQGDWISAGPVACRIRDEAEYQKSEAANKSEWRHFLNHATNLEVAARAQDRPGCAEELAALRFALSAAAGPERNV